MVTRAKRAGEDRLIKKYPNRRLYDTQTSTYVTLSDIKNLVMANEVFKVVDAKTEEDLTRNILLQIILEEEAGGAPVFSSQMLSQIIRFYGNSMQGLMGNYLEKTMQSFVDIHNKLGDQTKGLGAGSTPEAWSQMMNLQNPLMQGLMGNYMEQSKDLFIKMQEQVQGSQNIFGNFPFTPQPNKTEKE
ncbi:MULTISPECIES: polyhydroxyalkanoate synthesis repressor PhaR [unclassified Polynucleobacter]|jgi:polyhydroxyalkanoate synthesis repressor PhaR|uniref:polyhydroxyalkanoate synthesis repressor PhaR n=1 Tax=unclassified Polynucleobacter TaxID=2640945 RepID=UPI001BFE3593|nr:MULTISPECIES: polyhydroxyalkanoate synthesis repressor PhaR [unclassified Polynucleobacter]MBU3639205.1 polyhydroxyalkanoate synthesis repressor PhaR [Polynucleobacter sp. AP-RePozz3-80-G7]MBU3640370.1 polyhydroxyalkanoate synthesis repressor PhaR [Polynucleobacter sp. Fuers-14]MEA9601173.1 polyhydroxyalkanoate synthesis repressor PhaR [Polynucleobacter sp. MG-28-Ekke-A2]MEA9603969.1 polyhydroxyalkanoate synthesis repressor PhaR [Polynucleobacter sp. JS-JIR-II-c23]QWD82519.1 polyhydroxyalka